MKKIYALLIASVFTLPMFAQTATITKHFEGKQKAIHYFNGSDNSEGYITGQADDFHALKAQLFDASHGVDGFGVVTGVRLHFAEISNTVTDDFEVIIWENDGGLPGAVLATKMVVNGNVSANPTETIPESTIEYNVEVTFDSPVHIPGGDRSFWAGIKIRNTLTGILGLYATKNNQFGDAGTHTYTRGQGLTAFESFVEAYNKKIALAVFPMVDYNTGFGELENAGVTLAQNYPNPFQTQTVINYSVQERTHIALEVFDLTGKKVIDIAAGEKAIGTHSLTISAEKLEKGVYYYTLSSGSARLTKRMIVQ